MISRRQIITTTSSAASSSASLSSASTFSSSTPSSSEVNVDKKQHSKHCRATGKFCLVADDDDDDDDEIEDDDNEDNEDENDKLLMKRKQQNNNLDSNNKSNSTTNNKNTNYHLNLNDNILHLTANNNNNNNNNKERATTKQKADRRTTTAKQLIATSNCKLHAMSTPVWRSMSPLVTATTTAASELSLNEFKQQQQQRNNRTKISNSNNATCKQTNNKCCNNTSCYNQQLTANHLNGKQLKELQVNNSQQQQQQLCFENCSATEQSAHFDPYSVYGDNYDDDEDDVWYSDVKLFEDHLNEVKSKWKSIDDEIWAKIICMERNRRTAKAYARKHSLIIDGSNDEYLDGSSLGLNAFENSQRDSRTAQVKRKLGKGIQLRIAHSGDILVRRNCECQVFVYRRVGELHAQTTATSNNGKIATTTTTTTTTKASKSMSSFDLASASSSASSVGSSTTSFGGSSHALHNGNENKQCENINNLHLPFTFAHDNHQHHYHINNNNRRQTHYLNREKLLNSRASQINVPQNATIKLFDMQEFKARLQCESRLHKPNRALLQAACVGVISFGASDDNLLNLPCWLIVINIVALDLLDSTLGFTTTTAATPTSVVSRAELSLNCKVPSSQLGSFLADASRAQLKLATRKTRSKRRVPSSLVTTPLSLMRASSSPPPPLSPTELNANLILVSPTGFSPKLARKSASGKEFGASELPFASVRYFDESGACRLLKGDASNLPPQEAFNDDDNEDDDYDLDDYDTNIVLNADVADDELDALIPPHAQLAPPETQRNILRLIAKAAAKQKASRQQLRPLPILPTTTTANLSTTKLINNSNSGSSNANDSSGCNCQLNARTKLDDAHYRQGIGAKLTKSIEQRLKENLNLRLNIGVNSGGAVALHRKPRLLSQHLTPTRVAHSK